ncbi:MAG: hypothetical protein EOO01_44510, partial [Chitinophagaceae bacterium]
MKEQLYLILNTVTLIAYYLPLAVVLLRRLHKDKPIILFACYWSVGGTINLLGSTGVVSISTFNFIRLVFNIIDTPFVFYVFLLNTNVSYLRRVLKTLIPVFLLVELANGIFRGFTDDSFKYLQGLGVFMVLGVLVAEIVAYFQKLDHTPREKAMSFLFLAVLFEYAVYVYYYIYEYFIYAYLATGEERQDMNIIYYASSLIAIIIASIGFFSGALRKQPPQVQQPRAHETLIN